MQKVFCGVGTRTPRVLRKGDGGGVQGRDFAKLQMEPARSRTIPKGGPPTPTGRPKKGLKFKLFLVLGR